LFVTPLSGLGSFEDSAALVALEGPAYLQMEGPADLQMEGPSPLFQISGCPCPQ